MQQRKQEEQDSVRAIHQYYRRQLVRLMHILTFAFLDSGLLFFLVCSLQGTLFYSPGKYLIRRVLLPFTLNLVISLAAEHMEGQSRLEEEKKDFFCAVMMMLMGGVMAACHSQMTPLWVLPTMCLLTACVLLTRRVMKWLLLMNVVQILVPATCAIYLQPELRTNYVEVLVGVLLIAVFFYFIALRVQAYHGLVTDTVRKAARTEKEQEERLNYDYLTGVYSRANLTLRGRQTVEEYRGDVCVAMFDVDNFKKINDTYGHDTGDLVLKSFGRIMRSYMNEDLFAGRFGGEEFVIVFTGYSLEYSRFLVERICADFRSVRYDAFSETVTVSCGVAQRSPGETYDELLSRADKALYEAKRSGKDRVILHHEE